ncbi:hypothetical protein FA95DRAFT_1008917 [Auriscalpium vulgare]|uniref:Uncharacterized protein n=1 Tax=Auriscalpium vulgare TaxID=40419 RepID=A0ACB8RXZ2_9AGAM|nr:hypothetical protein FA95DRAFT_1008917 [Auriscalpium vulgare]
MSLDRRRITHRPHRDMDFALRSRDERIRTLDDEVRTLNAQADKTQRRLNAARAASHTQERASQIQERTIKQLRGKLHDVRAYYAEERNTLARELEESLRARDEERIRYEERIVELEEKLRLATSPRPPTPPMPVALPAPCYCSSQDSFIAAVSLAVADLQIIVSLCEEDLPESPDDSHTTFLPSLSDQGVQTSLDSELEQTAAQKIIDLERRCFEQELAAEDKQSRLEDYQARESALLAVAEESQRISAELEESFGVLLRCKDDFIEDLRTKATDLHAELSLVRQREATLERDLRDAQDRAVSADIEMADVRVRLEGAERTAVAKTNRIVQLETEGAAARRQLASADAQVADLQEAAAVAAQWAEQMERDVAAAQEELAASDVLVLDLRRELAGSSPAIEHSHPFAAMCDQCVQTEDELHEENDALSDEGSVSTLVTDVDNAALQAYDYKGADYLQEVYFDDMLPVAGVSTEAPTESVRALKGELAAMTLRFEAAEAARVCGEDIEEQLRAEIRSLRNSFDLRVDSSESDCDETDPDDNAQDIAPAKASSGTWGPFTLSPVAFEFCRDTEPSPRWDGDMDVRGGSLLGWDLPPIQEEDPDFADSDSDTEVF